MYAKLRRFHNYCTRRMLLLSQRLCRFHHISARYIQRRLGILDIDAYITRRHLRWAGHVARMSEDRLPRRFLSCCVRNPRPTGCPHFARTIQVPQESRHPTRRLVRPRTRTRALAQTDRQAVHRKTLKPSAHAPPSISRLDASWILPLRRALPKPSVPPLLLSPS